MWEEGSKQDRNILHSAWSLWFDEIFFGSLDDN